MGTVSSTSTGARVLVADAAGAARHRRVLEGDGHEVVVVRGELAEALHVADFDAAVVALDQCAELVRALRRHASFAEIVVVGPEDGVLADAFEHVAPERAAVALQRAVRRAIERSQLRREIFLHETCARTGVELSPLRRAAALVELAASTLLSDDAALYALEGPSLHLVHAVSNGPDIQEERERLVDLVLGGEGSLIADDQGTGAHVTWMRKAKIQSLLAHPLVDDRGAAVAILVASRRGLVKRRCGCEAAGAMGSFRERDLACATVLGAPMRLSVENDRAFRRALTEGRLTTASELAGAVAREIDNPLAYVGTSHALVLDKLDELADIGAGGGAVASLRGALADARDGADRIGEISRALGALSHGSGRTETFDLSDTARAALRICAARVRQIANVLVDLATDARVVGSEGRFCQLFVNLITNAAASAEAAGRPIDLVVTTERRKSEIVAIVQDTGPGICRDDLERAFDSLSRARPGLAVARQIVEDAGGELDVVSSASGTTFAIRLPIANVAPIRRHERLTTPNRARLLFVDDEFPLLRRYERWFGRDHDVVTVHSSARAAELFLRDPDFSAVVCDVVMPGMTGADLHARALAISSQLADRFVFVTGEGADADVRRRLVETGCPLVEKPIDVVQLRSALERVRTSS